MSNVERIINNQTFQWDSEKALLNWKKHTVNFEDAALVFADENRIERFDSEHSDDEDRYITIGKVESVLFVIIYTERGEITRLISARRATAKERGIIMLVTKVIDLNAPLTSEQLERLKLLENMTDDDIVFDEDCPPQTDEQLKLFQRVNPRRKDKAVG